MIAYNVTVKVEASIASDWLNWQLNEHLPAIMASGLFSGYKCYRLLEMDESEAVTFVTQLSTDSLEKYQRYIQDFATELRNQAFAKWGERFIAFRTVMEAVDTRSR